MRKYLFTNLLILVLATSVTSIVLSGCITNGPRLAYQVVGGTEVTVDVALAAYDAFAKAGKTTISQNVQVAHAYERFQLAFALVCDAGAVYSAGSTTNAPAAAALQQATLNSAATIADFLNLIRSFGVKI